MKIKLRRMVSLLLCFVMLVSLLPVQVFSEGASFTVTFDANGHGTAPEAQSVTEGGSASEPAGPSESGWEFGGWYTEAACENKYDFTAPVMADITLYAKWTAVSVVPATYTVTFDANGHGTAPAAQNVTSGAAASAPTAPFESGWEFGGWYTEAACENKYDFTAPVTGNITLYARWLPTYMVMFDACGHGTTPSALLITGGETISSPVLSEEGWIFDGWYTDEYCENPFDFAAPVTSNLTLYAKWIEIAPLTFDAETPSGNGPGWTWDASSATLTLDGLALTETMYLSRDLTIVLKNSNTVTTTGEKEAMVLNNAASVTVSGTGSLAVTATDSYALDMYGDNAFTVTGGKLSFTGDKYAIYDDEDSVLTVTGANAELEASGSKNAVIDVCMINVQNGAKLIVNDSKPAGRYAVSVRNLKVDASSTLRVNTPYGYSEGIDVWGTMDIGSNAIVTDGMLFRYEDSRHQIFIPDGSSSYLRIGGNDPWIDMSPNRSIPVKPGAPFVLEASAELKNAVGTVSYQWYLADSSWKYNPVAGQTGDSFWGSLPEVDGKMYYYRCVATAEVDGKTITAAANYDVSANSYWPNTVNIGPTTPSEDHLSFYGWKWDAATATLTLKDAALGQPLVITTDATIVLEGTSEIKRSSAAYYCLETKKASGASRGPVITVAGTGELKLLPSGTGAAVSLQSTDLTVEKDAKLTIERTTTYSNIGIDANQSKLTVNGELNITWYDGVPVFMTDSSLILNDGSRMNVRHYYTTTAIKGGRLSINGNAILLGRANTNIVQGRCVVAADALNLPVGTVTSNLTRTGANLYAETTNDKWAIGMALPTLKAAVQPQDVTIGKGTDTAVLTYTAKLENWTGGAVPINYQWYLDHSAIPGATNSTCEVGPFASVGNHELLCVASVTIDGVLYTAASRTVKITVCTGLAFRTSLQEKVFTASVGGTAPVITADAALFGGAAGSDITYTWYRARDYGSSYKTNAVQVATGSSFKPPITQRGGTYYFCTASAILADDTVVTADSGVFCVVVASKGKEPQLEPITINAESPSESHAKQGWAYDAPTHTLTLSGLELYTPFLMVDHLKISLPDLKIVLTPGTENRLRFLNFPGIEVAMVITGRGTLRVENISCFTGRSLAITVDGGATVIDTQTGSPFCSDAYKNVVLAVENGTLRFDNALVAVKELVIGAAGRLYTHGLQIGDNARVAGVLSSYRDNGYDALLCRVDGNAWAGGEPAMSRVLLEGTAAIAENTGDVLLIAPAGFKRTPITKLSPIQGEPAAKQKMTAGAITPADASVRYYWEYAVSAGSAEEYWNRCASGPEYTPDINRIGKYVRVTAVGIGDYSGTLVSAPVRIGGTGPYLVDLLMNGKTVDTNYNPAIAYSYATSYNEAVTVSAVLLNPAAQVRIENITEGAVFPADAVTAVDGTSGTIALYRAPGDTRTTNTIRFRVTLGDETRDYRLYVEALNYSTNVYFYGLDDASITVKWMENGTLKTFTPTDAENGVVLPANVVATVAGKSTLAGWYLDSFRNNQLDPSAEVIGGIRLVSFETDYTGGSLYFYGNDQRCAAPDMAVSWSKDSYGYFFQMEGDTLNLPNSGSYGGDCRIMATLLDENGKELWIRNDSDNSGISNLYENVNGRGQIRLWENSTMRSLDPNRQYTLKLRYNIGNTYYADEAEYVMSPVTGGFSVSENYIVLERPTGAASNEYAVSYHVEKPFSLNINKTGDSNVYCMTSNNELIITAQPGTKLGTTYFVLSMELNDGSILTETIRVDVVDKIGMVTADLTENSGSINVYQNTTIVIPVNVTGNPAPIVGARFEDFVLESNFELRAAGGRQLQLKLRDIYDDGTFDWAAKIKSLTGTRSSRIVLTLLDGSTVTTANAYKLVAKASAPAVSVSALKFNSFYKNQKLPLNLTCKQGTVQSVALDTGKAGLRTEPCPAWLETFADGNVALVSDAIAANKVKDKLYLKVKVEGYGLPVQVVVSASAVYEAPAVKLSNETMTLPQDGYKLYGAPMSLQPKGKGVSFASLNITELRTANRLDLTPAEQATYEASFRLQVAGFNAEDGSFRLIRNGVAEIAPGKVMLIATVGGNPEQQLRFTFALKVAPTSAVTLKTDSTSVTIDRGLGFDSGWSVDRAVVRIVPSVSGFNVGSVTSKVTDLNGQGDYITNGWFYVYTNTYECHIQVAKETPVGDYLLLLTPEGMEKPLTVKVTVKRVVPSLKFSKSSVAIDLCRYETIPVTITAANADYAFRFFNWDYTFTDSKGNDCKAQIGVYHNWTETKSSEWNLDINPGNGLKNGTYTLTYFNAASPDVKATLKVKVKTTVPTVKIDKTSVVLNTDLRDDDVAELRLTYPEGYDFRDFHDVQITDSKGNRADSDLFCTFGSVDTGLVRIGINSWAVKPGSTYKVSFNCSYYGANGYYDTNYITVTVKTAAQKDGITPITQKLKASGALDLSKASELIIGNTYNGWNGSKVNTAGPTVFWYAYLGDTMVAHSQNEVITPPIESWFTDVDPSEAGITLQVNTANPDWLNGKIVPGSYKLVVRTVFPKYNADNTDLVLEKSVNFKVSAGKPAIKAQNPVVLLSRLDSYDSKLVKLTLPEDCRSITAVTVQDADGCKYDCRLVQGGQGFAYLAIGWKNDQLPLIPSGGKMTVRLYLQGNDPALGAPNATLKLTVKIS